MNTPSTSRRKSIAACLVAALWSRPGQVQAVVPQTINYQGVLTENSVPVTGTRKFRFQIYDDPVANDTPLYDSINNFPNGISLQVSTGVFRTPIALPSTVNWQSVQPYMQVWVTSQTSFTTPLAPRDLISSSIYALFASTAETVVAGSMLDVNLGGPNPNTNPRTISGGMLGVGYAPGSSVQARLDVLPAAADPYILRVSSQNQTPLLTVGGGGTGNILSVNSINPPLVNDVMTITNNGNIGIGTVQPAYALDMYGSDKAGAGTIRVNAIVFSNGSGTLTGPPSSGSGGTGIFSEISTNNQLDLDANTSGGGYNLNLDNNNVVAMFVTPSGQIAMTPNHPFTPTPTSKLQVTTNVGAGPGDIRIDDGYSFASGGTLGTASANVDFPLLGADASGAWTRLISRNTSGGIEFLSNAQAVRMTMADSGAMTVANTLAVAGNAFSVSGSTLIVTSAGTVGVNMAAPNATMEIVDPNAGQLYVLILATGTLASQQVLTVSTSGVLTAKTGVTYGGDLAELYSSRDQAQAGDVVMLDGSKRFTVRKALGGRDTVLGVVATQPGVTIGTDDLGEKGRRVPVALSGRVPVRVTMENGAVKIGDPLVASMTRPGYAMKASATGRVIGIALENFDGRRPADKILCFVNPHTWVDPNDFEKLKGQFDLINKRLSTIESRLEKD